MDVIKSLAARTRVDEHVLCDYFADDECAALLAIGEESDVLVITNPLLFEYLIRLRHAAEISFINTPKSSNRRYIHQGQAFFRCFEHMKIIKIGAKHLKTLCDILPVTAYDYEGWHYHARTLSIRCFLPREHYPDFYLRDTRLWVVNPIASRNRTPMYRVRMTPDKKSWWAWSGLYSQYMFSAIDCNLACIPASRSSSTKAMTTMANILVAYNQDSTHMAVEQRTCDACGEHDHFVVWDYFDGDQTNKIYHYECMKTELKLDFMRRDFFLDWFRLQCVVTQMHTHRNGDYPKDFDERGIVLDTKWCVIACHDVEPIGDFRFIKNLPIIPGVRVDIYPRVRGSPAACDGVKSVRMRGVTNVHKHEVLLSNLYGIVRARTMFAKHPLIKTSARDQLVRLIETEARKLNV